MIIVDLTINNREQVSLKEVLFSGTNKSKLEQLLKEYAYLEELKKYQLKTNNKILLYGASGCGKTTTAKALANALGKPLIILNLSNIVSAKIGDTGRNVKFLFDKAAREKAILFLDEFDQLGKMRTNDDQDVGEMRRLVNTLIQLIDYFPEEGIFIAATNFYELIDPALLRRFQLKLKFELPTKDELDIYYNQLLDPFPLHLKSISRQYSISYAEVKDYVHTEMKAKIIAEVENRRINHKIHG